MELPYEPIVPVNREAFLFGVQDVYANIRATVEPKLVNVYKDL